MLGLAMLVQYRPGSCDQVSCDQVSCDQVSCDTVSCDIVSYYLEKQTVIILMDQLKELNCKTFTAWMNLTKIYLPHNYK